MHIYIYIYGSVRLIDLCFFSKKSDPGKKKEAARPARLAARQPANQQQADRLACQPASQPASPDPGKYNIFFYAVLAELSAQISQTPEQKKMDAGPASQPSSQTASQPSS